MEPESIVEAQAKPCTTCGGSKDGSVYDRCEKCIEGGIVGTEKRPQGWVQKGDRVLAQIRTIKHPIALSGAQPKVGLNIREFTGRVRHVRGDHPVTPKKIWVYVEPDQPQPDAKPCEKCGVNEVECSDDTTAFMVIS